MLYAAEYSYPKELPSDLNASQLGSIHGNISLYAVGLGGGEEET